jgi:large subunit ribosomal protein L32e
MVKSSPSKLKKAIKLKEKISSERPDFKRSETHRFPRLGDKWRSSKGIRSKMRLKKRSRSAIVETGYRSPVIARDLHPSGKAEVLVFRVHDLDSVDRVAEVVRIAAAVGARKRLEIIQAASTRRIAIVNIRLSEKPAKAEEETAEAEVEEEPEAEAEAEKEPETNADQDQAEEAESEKTEKEEAERK